MVPAVGLANDVAVLRLATPFTAASYPRNVRPVCLPSARLPLVGGYSLTVAGWGVGLTLSTTDELREVSTLECNSRVETCRLVHLVR